MENTDTLRNTWEFHYRTAEVLEACQRKASHHKDRQDWWESQMKQAETALKEKGFEYREEYNSRGADVVVVGDPQLMKRASDCKRKMEEHRQKQETYETWCRALGTKSLKEPERPLALKIEDLVFFGL